jgi:hypothetical protein
MTTKARKARLEASASGGIYRTPPKPKFKKIMEKKS